MRHDLHAAVAALMLAAAPAVAQSNHTLMPEGSRDVYLSLAGVWQQHPQGRAEDRILVVPLISAQWANGVFIDMNTIGMNLSEETALEYGPLFSPTVSDGERRRFTPELGGYVNWQVSRSLGVGAKLMGGAGQDRRGLNLSLGADLWTQVAPHHSVGVGLQTRLANGAALREDFGSAAYEPDSGLRDATLSLRWRWEVSRKLRMSAGISQQRYLGGAAASPRVQYKSGASLLTALTWRF
jgi:MipA family protein